MKSETSKPVNEKNVLILAAHLAESATDESMVSKFREVLAKYEKARLAGADQKKLDSIFLELSLLSYVNVIRMTNMKAADLIKDVDNVDKLFTLIKPNTN